ncbi:MAG: DNA-3-methyladenine glycosylase 2 family protein [Rhizobiaceae bacterium]|nr:DNA-3-methyladenine glycosylase 2 family protein [Rhizobiaceae bacterium]
MRRITTLDDVDEGLDALARLDPRLAAVRAAAGDVPLRLSEPGFASLASIVVSQQVSTASARAIYGRLGALLDPLTPEALLAGGEPVMRQAGLSGPKIRTLLAVAAATRDGLDLEELCGLEPGEAMARLVALPGIGPWTAEIYLLFCAGHPDIFPAKDIALQAAVGDALRLGHRPQPAALSEIAESWSPWRGVAARLFWAYYRATRGRDAMPTVTNP